MNENPYRAPEGEGTARVQPSPVRRPPQFWKYLFLGSATILVLVQALVIVQQSTSFKIAGMWLLSPGWAASAFLAIVGAFGWAISWSRHR